MSALGVILNEKGVSAVRVLCVDRDIFQLAHMKREVRKIVPEAHVSACRDPGKAMALAAAEGCDVLLTGIDMGASRTEGMELARKVKEINPRVNIIFVTVCDEREYAEEVFRLRASGYVRKPYGTEKLAEEFANFRYPLSNR